VLLAGFGWILTGSALAQEGGGDAFRNQQRLLRDQVLEQIERESPAAQKTSFDFGGSYSFHLFMYDDGIESSRTFRRNDLRVWSRLTLENGAHEFYVRGRLSYLDWNTGDAYDGNDDDWEGLDLERGYYQFDLARAMTAYGGAPGPANLRFKVGRDLVKYGTGLALWQVLDHVSLTGSLGNFELSGLVGRTVGSQWDIDQSRPLDRTRRAFFGAHLVYTGFARHRPFAYVLWQRDHNDETFPTPLQKWDYDSFYAGIGATGELCDNLFYSSELVYESGRSYGDRPPFFGGNDIEAWAFDAELRYLFDHKLRPQLSAEYLFASGDDDRFGSPIDTRGGSRDLDDSSFSAFGYRDTGLSFAPRISNLHMWRAGASFYPFAGRGVLDRMELGTNWFLYWKNQREGAVSDPTANLGSGYLGWEMDYYANWQITTDLTWTVRYGLFFPGEAFSDQTTRTFVLTGVTWSF
jgi:hypothetical protein